MPLLAETVRFGEEIGENQEHGSVDVIGMGVQELTPREYHVRCDRYARDGYVVSHVERVQDVDVAGEHLFVIVPENQGTESKA